jgi:hypothetical protein
MTRVSSSFSALHPHTSEKEFMEGGVTLNPIAHWKQYAREGAFPEIRAAPSGRKGELSVFLLIQFGIEAAVEEQKWV